MILIFSLSLYGTGRWSEANVKSVCRKMGKFVVCFGWIKARALTLREKHSYCRPIVWLLHLQNVRGFGRKNYGVRPEVKRGRRSFLFVHTNFLLSFSWIYERNILDVWGSLHICFTDTVNFLLKFYQLDGILSMERRNQCGNQGMFVSGASYIFSRKKAKKIDGS